MGTIRDPEFMQGVGFYAAKIGIEDRPRVMGLSQPRVLAVFEELCP